MRRPPKDHKPAITAALTLATVTVLVPAFAPVAVIAAMCAAVLYLSPHITRYHELRQRIAHDRSWFKRTYPEAARDGCITCHKCGSGQINVGRAPEFPGRLVLVHFCTRCRVVLYYSTEE